MAGQKLWWGMGALALVAGSGLLWRELPAPLAHQSASAGSDKLLASWPLPTQQLGARTADVATSYGRLPLYFERNEGQTDRQVQYLSRGNGYTLFLTPGEVVLSLAHTQAGGGQPAHTVTAALHAHIDGANPAAATSVEGELPGRSNYFIGADASQWHTGISQYAKVRYHDIYPGIDLVYYGHQQQLEYDFVLQPGVDAGQIHLSYEGADHPHLTAAGDLLLRTPAGDVVQHKPVVYQRIGGEQRVVDGRYAFNEKHELGFQLGDYDHSQPLVIDPMLAYSTYLGGSKGSTPGGIAVDGSGSAYVVGTTASLDFPTQNPLQASNTTTNVFVSKFSADGQSLVYSTYLGGSQAALGNAVAVDGSGAAYVVGSVSGNDFPTSLPYQASNTSSQPVAFLSKLAADGQSLVYSTYLGGSGGDSAAAVAVDSSNSAYVAGVAGSSNFPVQGALQGTLAGRQNAFLSKFSADGQSLVYSTYLGGSGASGSFIGDYASGVAVDGAGTAYLTGTTDSTDFPTHSPLQASLKGATNAFVAHVAADGSSLLYSTYLGGSGNGGIGDNGNAIAVDSSGNAYIAGSTESTDFPLQSAWQGSLHGVQDGFVSKLSADGQSLLYSTYLGGSGSDAALGIGLDGSDIAYVVGSTGSQDFPLQAAFQSVNHAGGSSTGFVTALNADGQSLAYSSYLGGSGKLSEAVTAVAVDGSGNAYVSGRTSSTDFPTQSPFQAGGKGTSSVFVSKISVGNTPSVALTLSPATIGLGKSSVLSWTSANATSCTASGAWSGLQATSGNLTITPTATGSQTYSLSCSGNGSSASGNATLTTIAVAPTVSLSAATTSLALGKSVKLAWTSNASSCTASGAWSGSLAASGSETVTPTAAGAQVFNLSCVSSVGLATSRSVTVLVKAPLPVMHLSLTPPAISTGAHSTLSWASSNTSGCTASGAWSGSQSSNGTLTLNPSAAGHYIYTLTCTGLGGSVHASAALTVTAPKPSLSLSVAPSSLKAGGSTVLSWSGTGISSCTASGAWSGSQAVAGAILVAEPMAGSFSYVLACSGAGGSISKTVHVVVTP